MKKITKGIVVGCLFVLILNFTSASASLEYVRRINFSHMFGQWYSYAGGSGSFTLNNTAVQGGFVYTHDDPSTYNFAGTITFTPLLIEDLSTLSLANGKFQAGTGVNVTLKGNLYEGGLVYSSGSDPLLQATIWGNSERTLNEWELTESVNSGDYEWTKLYLELADVGLASGITLTNGDVLQIGETELDLSLGDGNLNSDFDTEGSVFASIPTMPSRYELVATIPEATGVPEPGTMLLLGLGGLLMRKK